MSDLTDSLKSELTLAQRGAMAHAPLYHQLYTVLKSAILDGTIAYEAQMPTEHELRTAFDVSRITAKRAMDELAAENLIERFRGKGSHVTFQYIPKPITGPLVGMLESLIDMAEHDSVRVVSIEKLIPPAEIRELLSVSKGEKVHRVVRVNSNVEGQPYAYYVSWTVGVSKSFTKSKLESMPRIKLLRENGINLTEVKQVLSAHAATARVASELGVELGTSLLTVRRLGQIADGIVVDVLDGMYNPKRYQYAMIMSID